MGAVAALLILKHGSGIATILIQLGLDHGSIGPWVILKKKKHVPRSTLPPLNLGLETAMGP